jgi:hypothetical protein
MAKRRNTMVKKIRKQAKLSLNTLCQERSNNLRRQEGSRQEEREIIGSYISYLIFHNSYLFSCPITIFLKNSE